MPDRKCLTCKHYEPSPIRHKGWCRNPVLYSPQQSHLVDQDSLDCGHRYGNYWEAAAPDAAGPDNRAGADPTAPERRRLRFFEPRARLVAATASAGIVARSSGGAGGDDEDGPVPPPSRGGASGGQPPRSGQPRANRTGMPQGQERTVSYQPEERYWTDYLRIALPVVGLLLMLGLFWYWASSVIGDDDDEPEPTATVLAEVITVTPPPPTQAPDITVPAGEVTPTATGDGGAAADGEQTPPPDQPADGTEPTEEAEVLGKGFEPGDVVVTQGEVNLRGEPSADGELIATLEDGTELEVTEAAVEGGEYFWIGVRVTATDEEGYVADEFVDASE